MACKRGAYDLAEAAKIYEFLNTLVPPPAEDGSGKTDLDLPEGKGKQI